MVNKERVQLWISALRSNEYRQISSQLGNERGYCCLGVACEVAMLNGLEIERQVEYNGRINFDASSCDLPQSVKNWYGFDSVAVDLKDENTAMGRNDTDEYTFHKIANEVEEVYLG